MRDLKFTMIETERLVLHRFVPDDATAFADYRADPGVARYQSWGVFTPDDAERFIAELASADPGVPASGSSSRSPIA